MIDRVDIKLRESLAAGPRVVFPTKAIDFHFFSYQRIRFASQTRWRRIQPMRIFSAYKILKSFSLSLSLSLTLSRVEFAGAGNGGERAANSKDVDVNIPIVAKWIAY